jgi:hypothetical protein
MFKLTRIWLDAFGPPDARFDPLTIELIDEQGQPVDSVLWLVNGGGKSVLLKAMFAVLRPDQVQKIGGDRSHLKPGILPFIDGRDTAHVALEWVAADGRAVVTGGVFEWEGKVRSADGSKLRKTWYSFTPGFGALTLEALHGLARVHDGERERRVNRYGFLQRLREFEADNALNLVIEEARGKWLQRLDALGLDTVLFSHQLDMNKDEGGVEKLFQFPTERDFIEFLLRLTADADQLNQVSANLATLAEKFRALPRSELELAFIDGALQRLAPLAEAELARRGAERERGAARERARRTLENFRARATETAERRAQLAADYEAADDERAKAVTAARRANEQQSELRRRIAEFAIADAEARLVAAEQETRRLQLERDAWQATETLLTQRDLAAQVEELARELDFAEAEAAPLRARVEQAAQALGLRLRHELRAARADEKTQQQRAVDAKQARRDAEKATTELRLERQQAERDEREATEQLAQLERDRETLREQKVLAAGESGAAALGRVQVQYAAGVARLEQIETERGSTEMRKQQVAEKLSEAERTRERHERDREALSEEQGELERRRTRLEGAERLADLAEGRPHLALDGSRLAAALQAALAASERELVSHLAETAEERTLLQGIEQSGLLPAVRDLEHAVATLAAAGIQCTSGWRYLAEGATVAERARVLARRPELAGAVVMIGDPELRERAEAVLVGAGLEPRAVIPLITSAELVADVEAAERFVVPPTPALYDRDAAETARVRIQRQLAGAQATEQELATARDRDRRLADELDEFLARQPFERLEAIGSEFATLERHLTELADRRTRWADEQTLQADVLRGLADERTALELRLRLLPRQESELERLAAAEQDEEALRPQAEHAAAAARRLAGEIESTQARSEQAERVHGEAVELAAERRAAAGRLREELEKLAFELPEHESELVTPLDELRGRYQRQQRLLVEQTSGSELAERLRNARARLAELEPSVDELAMETRVRAEELLSSLDASDRSARRAALARFEAELNAAVAAEGWARGVVETAEAELEKVKQASQERPGRVLLPTEPRDRQEAEEMLAVADAQATAAYTARSDAERRLNDADAARKQAELDLERLEDWTRQLRELLGEDAEPPVVLTGELAFAGTIEQARTRYERVLRELNETATRARKAAELTASRGEALREFALDERYDELAGQVRDRLARDSAPAIAASAPERRRQLELRARTLRDEIAEMTRDKQTAVLQLETVVESAIKDLRQASRQSRLPESLPDWGGEDFLRIQIEKPSNEQMRGGLALVVDEVAAGELKLAGVELLVAALERVVGKQGFRTTILKPKADGVERVLVTNYSSETSGGQGATAAILLYCTLLGLRAHNQGVGRHSHTTLILDNPLGKATAVSLLRKQLAVAAAMGVQLVYTTGVNDLPALDEFPNLVRMRNDAELRKNLRYVRIAEQTRRAILRPVENGASGYLAQARGFRRSSPDEQLELRR